MVVINIKLFYLKHTLYIKKLLKQKKEVLESTANYVKTDALL